MGKVKYKKTNPKRLARTEHNETVFQDKAIEGGDLKTHPAIAEGIHTFANNPAAFESALSTSKIEPLTADMNVGNTDMGAKDPSIDEGKSKRVSEMLTKGKKIDRPIVLRYTNTVGAQFSHLLSGNTRATSVGPGVEAHIIDLGGNNE
jgi:hypothetical protein